MSIKKRICLILLAFASGLCCVLGGMVTVVKVKYPYAYTLAIKANVNKYGLDESLVRAIIKVESGYNETAISSVGATGLMQIMPRTAEWIAEELEIEEYSQEMLFNPQINIEFGCFYLWYLHEKYNDDYKVLFAYNAGEGVLNEYYKKDDTLKLETVEIVETKWYIERVLNARSVYERLSGLL